jgi:hypothetical protein
MQRPGLERKFPRHALASTASRMRCCCHLLYCAAYQGVRRVHMVDDTLLDKAWPGHHAERGQGQCDAVHQYTRAIPNVLLARFELPILEDRFGDPGPPPHTRWTHLGSESLVSGGFDGQPPKCIRRTHPLFRRRTAGRGNARRLLRTATLPHHRSNGLSPQRTVIHMDGG